MGRSGAGKRRSGSEGCPDFSPSPRARTATGVWLRFPSGERLRAEDPETPARVGAIVGESVTLALEDGVSHLDDSPLHLLTRASLRWLAGRVPDQLEVRRFRPNVVVETFEGPRASSSEGGSLSRPEDAWVGHALQIGSVVVRVAKPTERCVMVTLPQPGIHFAPQVLRELETAVEGRLGVYADVITEGDIGVGDEVVRVD